MWSLLEWCKSVQPIPSKNDFSISEGSDGLRFRLNAGALQAALLDTPFNLKLEDATASGVAQVRVLYGTTGGRPADPAMPSTGLIVPLTANGTRYILADMTVAYTAPVWTSTASAITEAGSVTAASGTHAYFEIGHAIRESDGGGGFRIQAGSLHSDLSGSQGFAREATASAPYADEHWKV